MRKVLLNKFGVSISFTKFLLKRSKTILWPFILFRTLDLEPIWFLAVLYFTELVAYPNIFSGIVRSIWLTFICRWFISSNTFLEHLGQNTITVLAVHELIKRIVLKIAEMGMRSFKMGITTIMIQKNTLYSLTIVAIVIASSWGVVNVLKLMKKHIPMYVRANLMAFIK